MMQHPRCGSIVLFLLCCFSPAMGDESSQSATAEAAPSQWITSIASLSDDGTFVAATANGLLMQPASVDRLTSDQPQARTQLYTHPAAVWCVVSFSEGTKIASVDYRGNLAIYDLAEANLTMHEKALERWCQSLIVAPSGDLLVAGNEAGKILVWNVADSKVAKSVELDGHAITGLAISPDQKQLAASDGSGQIHFLQWPNLEPVGKSKISDSPAWCVAYAPEGDQVLVGSGDNHLYQLGNQADAEAKVVATGQDWITNLAISESGEIAAGEVGGNLHMISNGMTATPVIKTFTSSSGVWSLCWNGTQELLVGSRKDGISRMGRSWDWIAEPKKSESETVPDEASNEEASEAASKEKETAQTSESAETPENPESNQADPNSK